MLTLIKHSSGWDRWTPSLRESWWWRRDDCSFHRWVQNCADVQSKRFDETKLVRRSERFSCGHREPLHEILYQSKEPQAQREAEDPGLGLGFIVCMHIHSNSYGNPARGGEIFQSGPQRWTDWPTSPIARCLLLVLQQKEPKSLPKHHLFNPRTTWNELIKEEQQKTECFSQEIID